MSVKIKPFEYGYTEWGKKFICERCGNDTFKIYGTDDERWWNELVECTKCKHKEDWSR